MKYFCAVFVLFLAGSLVFSSCAGLQPQKADPVSVVPIVHAVPVVPEKPAAVPELTAPIPEFVRPDLPEKIMGKGMVPQEKLAAFLVRNNARLENEFVLALAGHYIDESAVEGVNHDTAFAQMCLETGFLRYGGDVKPDQNNFCGLGAVGNGEPGLSFPDPLTGVRAHIQHLQAYASTGQLNLELVDPRYRYVKRGSSPTIHGLAGTWAADRSYNTKIAGILERLYTFCWE